MRKFFIFIILVLIVGGGVWYLASLDKDQPLSPAEVAKVQKEREEEAGIDSSSEATRYVNKNYGFSFEKPEGYTVGAIPESEESETVIVQNTHSSGGKDGFQIFIYPVSEKVNLTPQFIQADLPGTQVANAQKIVLDGAEGMMFESNNEAFEGSSFEIWVYRGGYIYQISSYSSFEDQLKAIIGTWQF